MTHVVIKVEGGVVQCVMADEPVEVLLIDWDVDDLDEKFLVKIGDDNAYCSIQDANMFVLSKGKPNALNFIEDKPNTAGGRVQKKDACINKGKQKDGDGYFIRKEVRRRTNIWRIAIGKIKKPKDIRQCSQNS
jgi:hypothetical protein